LSLDRAQAEKIAAQLDPNTKQKKRQLQVGDFNDDDDTGD
jgi:hypothetical protein